MNMKFDVRQWQSGRLDKVINLEKLPSEDLILEILAERQEGLQLDEALGLEIERQKKMVRGFLGNLKRLFPETFVQFSQRKEVEEIVERLFDSV